MTTEPEHTFVQTDALRDHVFPVFDTKVRDDSLEVRDYLGTGFFIGCHNFALTAAHVLRDAQHTPTVGVVEDGFGWHPFAVADWEEHPTEDIAVMQIAPPGPGSLEVDGAQVNLPRVAH